MDHPIDDSPAAAGDEPRRIDPAVLRDVHHLPDDAGEHAGGLLRILERIPDGWERWIDCGPGWYPLLVDLDAQIAALAPDYEIHQVKEKFGVLRFYWALPERSATCCVALDVRDPRPVVGAVSGPWVPKNRTAEEQALLDAWWSRRQTHLDSAAHAAGLTALRTSEETAQRRIAGVHIEQLVETAEAASAVTCEQCGAAGTLHNDRGWFQTLCGPCAAARGHGPT